MDELEYRKALRDQAHVLPRFPAASGVTLERQAATQLYAAQPRIARRSSASSIRATTGWPQACGACHLAIIAAAERSLMATGAMFWGGASYNNGILPFKRYILGEAYTRNGAAGADRKGPVLPRSGSGPHAARHPAQLYAAARVGDGPAGRHLPRVRARRTHDRQSVPRNRPARHHRRAAET